MPLSVLDYSAPWHLRNGLAMTLYIAWWASQRWTETLSEPPPDYQPHWFMGKEGVPIYGWVTNPPGAIATVVATYGITGSLDNQWFLQILARKAIAQNMAVVLFDWRAHGKTAERSPTLTSDGLNEGADFIHIAEQAKALGCPAPFWCMGFSLGGQLALWAAHGAGNLAPYPGLQPGDIGGVAVICPNLDSNRSLSYLMQAPLGRYVERAIAKELKRLAWHLHDLHPESIDPAAIERANSIRGFDQELVIGRLGYTSVADYYYASSPFRILADVTLPTLVLYAQDDPLFDPSVIPDLVNLCRTHPRVTLALTAQGGHVGYVSDRACQQQWGDRDPWWAWNRILQWCQAPSQPLSPPRTPQTEARSLSESSFKTILNKASH